MPANIFNANVVQAKTLIRAYLMLLDETFFRREVLIAKYMLTVTDSIEARIAASRMDPESPVCMVAHAVCTPEQWRERIAQINEETGETPDWTAAIADSSYLDALQALIVSLRDTFVA